MHVYTMRHFIAHQKLKQQLSWHAPIATCVYFGLKAGRAGISEAVRWADLSHLGMNVETWITELGDLLGKELYSLRGVAEDYRLVDLELQIKRKKQQWIQV